MALPPNTVRAILRGQARRYLLRSKITDQALAMRYREAASGVPPADSAFAYHVLVLLKSLDGAWHLDDVALHFGMPPSDYAKLAGTTPEALK